VARHAPRIVSYGTVLFDSWDKARLCAPMAETLST
jgi:hypothetical protein